MENFNPNFEPVTEQPKRAKEKSVYLLHLDGARIIILSALMVGILLTAFLVGMKYSGAPTEEDFPSDIATEQKDRNSDLLDSEKTSDSLSASDLDINSDNLTLPQEPAKSEAQSSQPVQEKVAAEPAKAPASDIIVSDKVEPAKAEPVKEVAIKREPTPVKVKVKIRQSSSKETKVASKQKAPAKTNKKVVEVSAAEPEFKHEAQIIRKPSVKAGSAFAIQIASYDTKAKAQKEMNALKAKCFDAYIDTASVGGKNFYRVKVGPISEKKEAISMMKELQSTPRYQESYIVVQ